MAENEKAITGDEHEIGLVMAHHLHRMLAGGTAYVDITDATQPKVATWTEWVRRWSDRGDHYTRLANAALELGNGLTAGRHLMSAALQYHYAQYMMYEPADIKVVAAQKAAAAFRAAAPLLRPERRPLNVQHGPTSIPAFVRYPLEGRSPFATVIIIPGLEASKEEMAGWEPYFLERGIATVVLDGVGQGELSHLELAPPDYVAAISAVVGALEALPEVDPKRIGIMGPSLGGLLTSMCLATERRFAAGVEVGGTFDTLSRWDRANVLSKKGHQFKTKSSSFDETKSKIASWTMEGLAQNIRAPLLVVHGENDHVVPIDQAEMYVKAVPHAELVVVPLGNHVCNNFSHVVRPLIADWFKGKIST